MAKAQAYFLVKVEANIDGSFTEWRDKVFDRLNREVDLAFNNHSTHVFVPAATVTHYNGNDLFGRKVSDVPPSVYPATAKLVEGLNEVSYSVNENGVPPKVRVVPDADGKPMTIGREFHSACPKCASGFKAVRGHVVTLSVSGEQFTVTCDHRWHNEGGDHSERGKYDKPEVTDL